MVQALALDMGSSQIKVGRLNEAGHIEVCGHEPAPLLKGRDGIRIANPQAYLHKASQLLQMAPAPKDTPLGISTQRSSFTLWHAKTGKTLTPLISWQDLRADTWCKAHRFMADEVRTLTGLPLSPYYAAAKLAVLFEEHKDLRRLAGRGMLRFGTLETFVLWHWTEGQVHHMDVSMAARTQLVELKSKSWSSRLLSLFGVPESILPTIAVGSYTYPNQTGYPVTATVADQAACALPIFQSEGDVAFINAGTATFLMRAVDEPAPEGLLSVLLPKVRQLEAKLIWEAPINAGARILRGFKLPTEIIKADADPTPDAFAVADVAGLGAPHWRPDLGNRLSEQARDLGFRDRQRVQFESLVFRTREVLAALFGNTPPDKVVLAGGLSARFDYSQTLASLLDVPVFVLKEKEMSLWGAAWLAARSEPLPKFQQKQLVPRFQASYLRDKYPRWKAWLATCLAEAPPSGAQDAP